MRQQWRGGGGGGAGCRRRHGEVVGSGGGQAGKNEKEPPEPSLKGVGAKICGADLDAEICGADPRATLAPQKHHVSHLDANCFGADPC